MTYRDIYHKINDQPFKPFRIRLVNNSVYDIWEPWMVQPGRSSAIVVTQSEEDDRGIRTASEWKTVSISHLLEFSDLQKRNGSKRKK